MPATVTLSLIRQAAAALQGVVHRTPLIPSATLSELSSARLFLKGENLQKTGSFKVRGAFNKVRSLSEAEKAAGVVCASAGNHAQGVALAARLVGVGATVVMPTCAAVSKVAATRGYGAKVVLAGDCYDDAWQEARQLAQGSGAAFIPAFDDPLVVAGQGSLALEVLEQLPRLEALVLPVGGGGLAAGCALAVKELCPRVAVWGVQAKGAAALPVSLAEGQPVALPEVATIADGIAVKRPGDLPFRVLQHYLDGVVTVADEEIAAAMLLLLERSKLVVEPAGAAALAAVLGNLLPTKGRRVVVVLSGGNVDPLVLERVVERGLAKAGRFLHLETRLPDRPGALQRLLAVAAAAGANTLSVDHSRLAPTLSLLQAEVELVLETRDAAHQQQVLEAIRAEGLQVVVLNSISIGNGRMD